MWRLRTLPVERSFDRRVGGGSPCGLRLQHRRHEVRRRARYLGGLRGRKPAMASNSFGEAFRVTTWESHGPAIGCVIDGAPPLIRISESDIQYDLDRRAGPSRFTTQRREADEVRILSGVFEGQTTGTPIGPSSKTRISGPRTTARSRTGSAPATRILPMTPSTASGTTAAGGRRRGKRRCGWLRVRSRARF